MYYQTSDQERVKLGFGGHECNNGVHFCGLYETDKERNDIIFAFIRQGIEDEAVVHYIPSGNSTDETFEKLLAEFPEEIDLISGHHHLNINIADDVYYQDGELSPSGMIRNLEKIFEQSQQEGKKDIRASADMEWALERELDLKKLMAYESGLNYFVPGKPWVSICMYNLTRFDGKTIMKVLQTHPYTISKDGLIMKNPYYVKPGEWLAENAPEYAKQLTGNHE